MIQGKRRSCLFVFVFIFLLSNMRVTPVNAMMYGRGVYGRCAYVMCSVPSPTILTLDTGLRVSINLIDGQIIQSDGYMIVVTPLNGHGVTFKETAFYVHNRLIATILPDSTGTARWFLSPNKDKTTDLKIVVTGNDGSIITQTYHVQWNMPEQVTVKDRGSAPSTFLQPYYNFLLNVVRSLPKPVFYLLPYGLLLVVGINLILLILQSKREFKELLTLRDLIDRQNALNELKRNFIGLAAHYLRTPLSVMEAGISLIGRDTRTVDLGTNLRTITNSMQQKTERLINSAISTVNKKGLLDPEEIRTNNFRHQIYMILTVLLLGGVIVALAMWFSAFKIISSKNITTLFQISLCITLLLFTYQIARRIQLRRRDIKRLTQVLSAESVTARARDRLIIKAIKDLYGDLQALTQALEGRGEEVQYIQQGKAEFQEVLTKFIIAQQIKTMKIEASYGYISNKELFEDAIRSVLQKVTRKHLRIDYPQARGLHLRSPNLFMFVVKCILDNAIAYSPESAVITITEKETKNWEYITILDHGSGILQDKIALLFQAFSKAEDIETFTHEGMGFSLYLCRLIMTYLGGAIELESNKGKGTIVRLRLPKPQST